MTKPLGRSFGNELIAAGIGHLPVSWSPDGTFSGRGDLSADDNRRLDAVIEAHDADAQIVRLASDDQLAQFEAWLPTASSGDIDKWIDANDPKLVLKVIVKALAAR